MVGLPLEHQCGATDQNIFIRCVSRSIDRQLLTVDADTNCEKIGNVNLFDSDEDLSSCDGLTTAACTEFHQSSRESSVTTAMSSSEDLDSQEDSSSSTASNSTPLPLQNICQGNSFRSLSPEQKQLIVDEVTGVSILSSNTRSNCVAP